MEAESFGRELGSFEMPVMTSLGQWLDAMVLSWKPPGQPGRAQAESQLDRLLSAKFPLLWLCSETGTVAGEVFRSVFTTSLMSASRCRDWKISRFVHDLVIVFGLEHRIFLPRLMLHAELLQQGTPQGSSVYRHTRLLYSYDPEVRDCVRIMFGV